MTTHVRYGLTDEPLCAETVSEGDELIDIAEVLRADGRHFDCVDCHRVLSLGHKHAPQPGSDE